MPIILRAPATASAPELLLRPWRDDDQDALIVAHQDPVLRSRTRFPVRSTADARRFVDEVREDWQAGVRFAFAVCEPDPHGGDRLVANVVLKKVAPGRPDAEVGYWTAAPARGRGVAGRAVDAVSRWAFAHFAGLTRLDLLHQIDNPASCRVAEKAGFGFVEVLPARPPFPRDGHRHVRHATAVG
ncbi:GNAT family N-acetyltransferase [Micromonospora avicenniae]|uniref:Protein N-acetyltransferase, RimJ/RimL family n=1 Tax=Micromonospora avicenniae TaxID=1198245 RepID=A0A1N7C5V7_9ACTN|nr:GNAT family N-acetyltransferase [Micromonospora avicenniae]SIR58959.1 Protein N-acetyltransferase, RimJ/RimL family [Micromonospora avicenniae]